jgi:hypothetical protein
MIDFNQFCDRFVCSPWADLDKRPKLVKALRMFWERVPAFEYEDLPQLTIIAPGEFDDVHVVPVPVSMPGGLMMYFAPYLERRPQDRSDFAVAHAFAQATLQDVGPAGDIEIAADGRVLFWGYEIPEYHKRKRNRS